MAAICITHGKSAIPCWHTTVSPMPQVVMMGTQLYNDALVPQHHKYAAHQVALLYVSVLPGQTCRRSNMQTCPLAVH